MFNTYQEWFAVASATSYALVKYKPQYSLYQSYALTGIAIFFAEWLVWITYSVVLYPRYLSPLRDLPGPKADSFFNGHWETIAKEQVAVPMKRWINEIPNDGLIRYMHIGNKERVLVTNPKGIAEVLTQKSYIFVKPDQFRLGTGRLAGDGLLVSESDVHKIQRKNLMPAFSFRHIKELYPMFWDKALELNSRIEQHTKGTGDNAIEVGDWVSRATLDIIGLAGMGSDIGTIENPNNDLSRTYKAVLSPKGSSQTLRALGFLLPYWLVIHLPIKQNLDTKASLKAARQAAKDIVGSRKVQIQEKGDSAVDIISVALQSGIFKGDELVDHMMTFFLAGHETVSTSMQWGIYALAYRPENQLRLRQEVQSRLSPKRPLTAEALDALSYLHAFCHEVLRFHNPVPITLRQAGTSTTILGQYIPKGTDVIICGGAMNFSTELWGPDAHEFNPERWLNDDGTPNNTGGATSNYAFMTFIHGPRSCIGQNFAVAEFKTLIAAWVGTWETVLQDPLPPEKIEIVGRATAKPANGMHVQVKKVRWQ